MKATLTELRRQTGKVLSALNRDKTVQLTDHGNPVAVLTPQKGPITGKEFAMLWRDRRRLDKATAGEVLRNIRSARQADALPH